tara:strand:+ start:185 stop:634 length:450 start_codon:yes stop_codon:yes gene_type:complete
MVALVHMKEQYSQETGRVVTLAPDQAALHTKAQGIGMLIILVQEHLEIRVEQAAMEVLEALEGDTQQALHMEMPLETEVKVEMIDQKKEEEGEKQQKEKEKGERKKRQEGLKKNALGSWEKQKHLQFQELMHLGMEMQQKNMLRHTSND